MFLLFYISSWLWMALNIPAPQSHWISLLCTYSCMCRYTCRFAHMYLCAHVHGTSRTILVVLHTPLALFPFLRQGPEFTSRLAWLASESQDSGSLCWHYKNMPSHLPFFLHRSFGTWTREPTLFCSKDVLQRFLQPNIENLIVCQSLFKV